MDRQFYRIVKEQVKGYLAEIDTHLSRYPVHFLGTTESTLQEYRERSRRVKDIESIVDLSEEINQIRILSSRPQIVGAFLGTGRVGLQGEVDSYLQSPNEQGGKLVPNVRYNGQKELYLTLRHTTEGTSKRIIRIGDIEDGEIGKWHTHPGNMPIPSDFDLLSPETDMLFPHLILVRGKSRLYINPFLGILGSPTLQAQVATYTAENREDDILDAAGVDPEMRAKKKELLRMFDMGYAIMRRPIAYIPVCV